MMKKFSPHLPPWACSIKGRQQWYFLKWLLFMVFISSLAGLSMTLVAMTWILPSSFALDSLYMVNRPSSSVDFTGSLSADMVRRVRLRLIKVYNGTQELEGGFYPVEAKVAQAAVLSSDGWAVMYMPNFGAQLQTKFWVGIDSYGKKHETENILFDKKTGLVFVKFSGEDFRVNSFLSADDLRRGQILWSINGSWKKTLLGEKHSIVGRTQMVSDEYDRFSLETNLGGGNVVVNEGGDIAGFVDEDNQLLSIWWAEHFLSGILDRGEIDYNLLGLQGFFVEGEAENGGWGEVGFYISNKNKQITPNLEMGDILVELNKEKINRSTLHRKILELSGDYEMVVVRDKERVEVFGSR